MFLHVDHNLDFKKCPLTSHDINLYIQNRYFV